MICIYHKTNQLTFGIQAPTVSKKLTLKNYIKNLMLKNHVIGGMIKYQTDNTQKAEAKPLCWDFRCHLNSVKNKLLISRQEYEDVMELNQALGLNLTPSALSLEVNGPDGSTIEIDSDSALTSFLRKNLKRAEQLPEQEFILSAKEARKRRGKGTVTNDVT